MLEVYTDYYIHPHHWSNLVQLKKWEDCLSLILIILIGLSSSLLPKSPRDVINNNIITSSTTSIAILSSLILPTVVNADGKLEYQPALQGLDYGKPRYHFLKLSSSISTLLLLSSIPS